MAKQTELKKKILKILPKAVTAGVTFQNPPFSPRWDHHHKYYKHPSMIPEEARIRKAKNGGGTGHQSTKSLEPTSPTVSCMGKIKHKKHRHQQHVKKAKAMPISLPKVHSTRTLPLPRSVSEVKKHKSTFQRIFLRRDRKSSRALVVDGGSDGAAPPQLSQMKRLASGRSALANFDWKAHVVAPEGDDDDEADEILISYSEPIMVGGGLALIPRTEINLWKRRTVARPPPLRLNPPPPPV